LSNSMKKEMMDGAVVTDASYLSSAKYGIKLTEKQKTSLQ